MDDSTPRTIDELTAEVTSAAVQPAPESLRLTEEEERALEESPDVEDDGEGLEADLDYLFEKNDELFRRLAL